jgi:hypothetical protein
MNINDIFGGNSARPDKPDFWRLSEIVLKFDGRMQAATTDDEKEVVWQEAYAEHAEMDCVAYMAMQRTFHILGIRSKMELLAMQTEVAKLTTVYMEGFLLGCEFRKAGGHRDS